MFFRQLKFINPSNIQQLRFFGSLSVTRDGFVYRIGNHHSYDHSRTDVKIVVQQIVFTQNWNGQQNGVHRFQVNAQCHGKSSKAFHDFDGGQKRKRGAHDSQKQQPTKITSGHFKQVSVQHSLTGKYHRHKHQTDRHFVQGDA